MNRSCYSGVPAALVLAVVLSGCESDSDDDGSGGSVSDDANPILVSTRFASGGTLGTLQTSAAPSTSDSLERPEAFSTPDVALLDADGRARIELAYRTAAALERAYLTVANEAGHVELVLDETSEDEAGGGEERFDGTRQSIIVDIERESAPEALHCYAIRVRDSTTLVSADSTVCTVGAEPGTEAGRRVYLSSFDSSSRLSVLSLDTGEIEPIGETGVQLTDIAFLGESLYGVTFGGLVRIDPESAETTVVGSLGAVGANALEAVDGVLYAATLNGTLLQIDPQTGAATLAAMLPEGSASSGDLVHVTDTGTLYGTVRFGGTPSDVLIAIDLESGSSRVVGETGFENVWGLGIARDQLVGLTIDGRYILIDPDTAESVLVEQTAALSASGASLAP